MRHEIKVNLFSTSLKDMKKITSTIALLLSTFLCFAQETTTLDDASLPKPGNTSLNIYGGISAPLGTYKGDIGRAELGPLLGIGLDHYFKGNHWGIGVDFRYFQHNMRKFDMDTFHFATGFKVMDQSNAAGFKNYALSIGPSYKYSSGKLAIEAFVRGGVLFQKFPEYSEKLYLFDPSTSIATEELTPFYTDNAINNPKSLMGLVGAKLSYSFNNNIGVFIQADYLRGFGEKLGDGKSKFYVTNNDVIKEIEKEDKLYIRDGYTNIYEYYSEKKTTRETFVQTINVSAGLKFSFGGNSKQGSSSGGGTLGNKNDIGSRAILVVVKDKKTGLALSGVKVIISSKEGGENISITNSNGEADRVKNPKVGTYTIRGDKNGIATTTATVDAADFAKNNSVIYKEIFQDDPRFTLVGSTVECERYQAITGISTILSNTSNHTVANQISDNNGQFIYQLNPDENYTIVANEKGKYSQTEMVTTKGLDRNKTLFVTLKLGICPLEEGSSFVLKNILYDFDKSYIRNDAAHVLNNLVNIMKENPGLKIELSAHTDSRGDDNYNQRLSQQRAHAAVQYLISKGISKSRITAIGYGETKLINNCGNGVSCSEEQHQQNRRTEIKILKL